MIAAGPYTERIEAARYVFRHCAAMQCQGCRQFILGLVGATKANLLEYIKHYPLGSPDDAVDESVPQAIADDFAEAKRCVWIKAYKAAVAMCRRSVEAACKREGATGRDLEKRIDDLAQKGKITEPLRQMAHVVRLSGNRSLHGKKTSGPPETDAVTEKDTESVLPVVDDLDTFGEDEANAMIAFVEQFFYHLYAMPALLERYSPKPKGEASESS
jgi:hypothetical protein